MVNANYLEQFRNECALEYLAGIPETRITERLQHYHRNLQKYFSEAAGIDDKRLESIEWHDREMESDPVPAEEVQKIFAQVQAFTETTLGFSDKPKCTLNLFEDKRLGFSGFYDRGTKSIELERGELYSFANLIGVLAHEHAHHCLATHLSAPYRRTEIFEEGYAEGMGRFAQLFFAEITKDERCRRLAWGSAFRHLKWGRTTPKELPPKTFGNVARDQYIDNNKHCLGGMLFDLLESERGPDIYRQILHGEFKW